MRSLPDASHETFAYDAAGRLVQANDPLSRATQLAYNTHSQLTARRDAEGRQVQLTYDAAQRLTTLVNENGQHFGFQYDAADRMVQETRVGGQRVTVEYDANGWPTAVTHHPGAGDLAAGLPSGEPQNQPLRTELVRDAAGRLVEKRTAAHHYHYAYDPLDQLVRAQKLAVQADGSLKPLHTSTFAYDKVGNLTEETATDETTGQSHTLRHSHDALGNRTQTVLPALHGRPTERALNYLHYGSGHLHQINLSQRDTRASPGTPDAQAIHQLICDIERDNLHQEILRSQGKAQTRFAYDPVGRLTGAWSQSSSQVSQPFGPKDPGAPAWQQALEQLAAPATSARSGHAHGLLKAWRYDKVGELRASRHSLQGDKGHSYDATGRILQTQHAPLAGIRGAQNPLPQAANETFGYDPAGNIQDSATQQAVQSSTALSQRGYVRDNLVRVFEDKRYFYDGHGRLIRKLAGKHTDQGFAWDEENNLTQVTTTRRPGTEHATTQTTTFDYDAIGRRVAKHDAFGTTVFIWEGMRLIEERRGQSVISYVYEPGSYVPLARLDAQGQSTDQGGLGTTQDAEPKSTPETIATSACHISAGGKKYHQSQQPAANDAEAQYWEALDTQTGTAQKTGTEAKLCDVYYFHTDQAGLPQELTNAQGQLVWQANYKTWGSTVSEEWEVKSLDNQPVHTLDQGDSPKGEETRQQNLRFQGQYLDRETGLHYNTFRYYDADIGRFVSPDPIGLEGGINLGSYSPNPMGWIDPWGLTKCGLSAADKRKMGPAPAGMVNPHRHHIIREMAPKNWTKAERGPIHHAQNLAKKFGIDVNKSLKNFTWAQNGGGAHTKQAAAHVRDVLVPAAKQGKAAFERALADLGKKMSRGEFF